LPEFPESRPLTINIPARLGVRSDVDLPRGQCKIAKCGFLHSQPCRLGRFESCQPDSLTCTFALPAKIVRYPCDVCQPTPVGKGLLAPCDHRRTALVVEFSLIRPQFRPAN
jgi:hypothetical protein